MLKTRITHWFPFVTFCPVNSLPDFIFIEITFDNTFVELYAVRKNLRRLVQGKKIFMEDVLSLVAEHYSTASSITVRLAFNKHVVTLER